MKLNYLPVKPGNIDRRPDRFIAEVKGKKYRFEVRFSPFSGAGYMSIWEIDNTPVLTGAALQYGADVLRSLDTDFGVMPLGKSREVEKEGLTAENIGGDVRLYII